MYASLGRRLFEAETMGSALVIIKELKQKLRDRVPSLEEVKALFPEIVQTDQFSKQRSLVRYILAAFYANARTGVVADFEKMSIEHLLPQSQIGAGELTDMVVGQLGNLILVSPEMNDKLKNRPFVEKKRILKEAGYVLPKEVAEANDWGAAQIRARTDAMAVQAYSKLWKI